MVDVKWQRVLTSRWAASSLWWSESDGWTWMFDRPIGTLTDAEVLSKYGDEAFRRRGVLREIEAQIFEPEFAELVGRRVLDSVTRAGWVAEVDDARRLRISRGDQTLEVDGSVSEQLTLTGAGAQSVVVDLDLAEQWITRTAGVVALARGGGV